MERLKLMMTVNGEIVFQHTSANTHHSVERTEKEIVIRLPIPDNEYQQEGN